MRSIQAPDTIDAAVHENSKNAAQSTPFSLAQLAVSSAVNPADAGTPPICEPISSLQGVAQGASTKSPIMKGPFGKAE